MTDKETTRLEWHRTLAKTDVAAHWGKAAEKLRALATYRSAKTVFSTPAEQLLQARINCLVDGKNLIMPASSIREGFYLLPARTVPFKELSVAVTYKGLAKHGLLLKNDIISGTPVDMLLTGTLVVGPEGGRIGDGQGFFDLCCALLHELEGLQPGWQAIAFATEEQLSQKSLPQDNWDIKMSGAITPATILSFDPPPQYPQIYWDMLDRTRIKRIDPLWKLYRKAQGTEHRAKG